MMDPPAFCGFRYHLCLLLGSLAGHVCLGDTNATAILPERYRLEIRLEPATHRISGVAKIKLSAWSSGPLRFLLNRELTVTAVRAGTNALSFSPGPPEREARPLLVAPGEFSAGEEISIEYNGTVPPPGPNDPDWMGAMVLRADEIRMTEQTKWFPMLEGKRAPVEATIILPADLVLVSPAEATRVDTDSGTATWRALCAHPAAPALIAGKLKCKQIPSNVRVALFPDQADHAEAILQSTREILGFMESRFGHCPFDGPTVCQMRVLNRRFSYNFAAPGIVVLPTEIVAMAGRADRKTFWTRKLAHEIAHQWWGCGLELPHEPWSASESLAEFAAASYQQSLEPAKSLAEFFEAEIEETRLQSYLARNGQPVDERTFRKSVAYQKGPVVLGMLRELLGHERFDTALRGFYARHSFGSATTAELQAAFAKCDGVPLDLFFDQWLGRRVLPRINVEAAARDGGRITLQILQEEPLFTFPLEILLRTEAGPAAVSCMVTGAQQRIDTTLQGRVKWTRVDPKGMAFLEMPDGAAEAGRYVLAAKVAYSNVFKAEDSFGLNLSALKSLRDVFRTCLTALEVERFRDRLHREGKIDLKTAFELERHERIKLGLEQLAESKDLALVIRDIENAADDILDGIRDQRTEALEENRKKLVQAWERFQTAMPVDEL